MKLNCPYCNQTIELSATKAGDVQVVKNVVEPSMIKRELSENTITKLVNKTEVSDTPTATDIQDNTYINYLPDGSYWKDEHKKDLIVLHFTAGYNWQSAYSVFKKPNRVATPFVIDIKGPKYIVSLYEEKYWSYHLGIRGVECRNWINDKRSIGIEIVNIGPAWNKNGKWVDYVKKEWPEDQIVKGKNRDADGGVKFPDEQVQAVCELVNFLCNKWNIPRKVPKDKMSYQLPAIGSFKGIAAHQMFRQDKYDMGVAWPWDKMAEVCRLKEVDL